MRPEINRSPEGLHVDGAPSRLDGIRRGYSPADGERPAGSFQMQHTMTDRGARR